MLIKSNIHLTKGFEGFGMSAEFCLLWKFIKNWINMKPLEFPKGTCNAEVFQFKERRKKKVK